VRRDRKSGSRELFVDTSAWYALLLKAHPDHTRVAAALRGTLKSGERAVTTNLVLAETYALLLSRGHRAAAITFLAAVRKIPNVVVTSTEELEQRALSDWLMPFDDQDFSLADAVSFAVMQERGIRRAVTFDAHFAIAGFEMIPVD
jgi:predicted nucleic acid-binding protein